MGQGSLVDAFKFRYGSAWKGLQQPAAVRGIPAANARFPPTVMLGVVL